jgi:hypothetical protein
VRARHLALTLTILASACGTPAAGDGPVLVLPAPSGATLSGTPDRSAPPPTATTSASPKPTRTPSRTPSPKRTTTATTGSLPPDCVLGDVSYRMTLSSTVDSNEQIGGSLLMKNVSGGTCRVHSYPTVVWRDAAGAAISLTVTRIQDPQLAGAYLIRAGEAAVVGWRWQRYPAGSTMPCTPAPATIDFRFEKTGPAKRLAWFGGISRGVCGSTIAMTNVQRAP